MSETRMRGTIVTRHIVKGNEANRLSHPQSDGTTHHWRVFIRGPGDVDISIWLKKVVFHLHPSFKVPDRTCQAPPYEIKESGWGEFEVGATLFFSDADEPPIKAMFQLRLHPPGPQKAGRPQSVVWNEAYEQLLFHDPKPSFFYALTTVPEPMPLPPLRVYISPAELEDDSLLVRLTEAEKLVKDRLKEAMNEYKRTQALLNRLRGEVTALEKQEGRPFDSSDFKNFKV